MVKDKHPSTQKAGCIGSLKMALVFLSLFLLLQLPTIPAIGLLKPRKACGTYLVNDPNHELFYVDGKSVDRRSFCKTLEARHCSSVAYEYCGFDTFLVNLPLEQGRKILQDVVREHGSTGNDDGKYQTKKDKYAKRSLSIPKSVAMGVPLVFVLCCAVVCPCFQARKKEIGHTVLPKDLNSMDSISSLEMNSVSEKILGSPLRAIGSPMRAPGSPLRVPASPLRHPQSPSRFSMSPQLSRVGSVHLNMSQVARVTHNFSRSLVIGEGGFGTVYKAELPGGQVVAIKRARKEHVEALQTEFRSEVELLAKIDHRNLVKLLGYVEKGNERLIITEYVPNGTLREHLDGQRGNILDFNQRLEISIDVAHGLTYLHLYAEKQIIHRDVKSSNILLTESMRAKVADFGFARLGEDSEKTHVSTKVKGTVGYLDPEYMRTYQLTPKSDVYSFGVLLLEILTGRRPVDLKRPPDERVAIRWAFRKYNEGRFKEMLDPLMIETVEMEILAKMFDLAIQCAAPTRADRPDMKTVGEQLWGIRMDYLRTGRKQG